jgi:hypothetical protein
MTNFDLWSAERVTKLCDLANEGLSAAQIAKQFDKLFTRNAILGKLHRLRRAGLIGPSKVPPCRLKHRPPAPPTQRTAPNRPPRFAPSTRPPRDYKRAPAPKGIAAPTGERRAVLADLGPHQCRWIADDFVNGDGAAQFMCGEATVDENKPYCAYHTALAFIPESASAARRRTDSTARAVLYFARRG